MDSKVQYISKRAELGRVGCLAVNEVLSQVMEIYSASESLIDDIRAMEPLKKVQNFKRVENMLYKIDANLTEVLKVYSLNLGNEKNTRLKKVFIDSLIFSLSYEIDKVLMLLD